MRARHAQTDRSRQHHDHRRGPDRDRTGLRVRLFRRASLQGAAEEGYRVILVNSNPATIMTDPGLADATYIEPITPEVVARIIEKERPDALLPTMGGQTALNTAIALDDDGTLKKFNVQLIGANRHAIETAEDRALFRAAMDRIGLENPRATIVEAPKTAKGRDIAEGLRRAVEALDTVGLPAIIRPAFTLGGTGGGVAYNREEYEAICRAGLEASPVGQILIDESLSAGRSSRWRWSATRRTTASSSAPSRTSTRWACTPATRSPSPRR
jgi:carbamoylphosphate synthase large subunit